MKQIILEARHLKKSFGDKVVHRDINFELEQGESLGLLGGSGSGKSVLLRSLIGLDKIDEGEILFKGKRLDQLSEDELMPFRIKISYSFQSGALFDSLTVFENLAYPLKEHTNFSKEEIKACVADLLLRVDLSGTEELMPSELSGGMQKRIGLARSLALNPDIILYDEPTAGLDPLSTVSVLEIIEKLKREKHSSIFVTHDIPSAIKVCDRILILRDGVIAYNDTPENLMASNDSFVASFFSHNEGKGSQYGK